MLCPALPVQLWACEDCSCLQTCACGGLEVSLHGQVEVPLLDWVDSSTGQLCHVGSMPANLCVGHWRALLQWVD